MEPLRAGVDGRDHVRVAASLAAAAALTEALRVG